MDRTSLGAATLCQSEGGFLTSIQDQAELDWLTSQFNLLSLSLGKHIHIGYNDRDTEGEKEENLFSLMGNLRKNGKKT